MYFLPNRPFDLSQVVWEWLNVRFATLKLYFPANWICNKAAFLCMGISQNLDFGFFVCNIVWIGQNLQNEEPVERTT